VRVDVRAHLDLFDLDDLLVLARFGRLLLVGVFQLSQIEDLRDWRIGVRRYLDEIESRFFSGEQRIVYGDFTEISAVDADELNTRDPDVGVCAGAVLGRRGSLEWSANGSRLLSCLRSGFRGPRLCGGATAQVNSTQRTINHLTPGRPPACRPLRRSRSAGAALPARRRLCQKASALHWDRWMAEAHFLDHDGTPIAYRRIEGRSPGVVWLGGYRSDMLGTKAETLSGWAERNGRAFLRFDHSGHGESGGAFAEGTISKWLAEAFAAFRVLTVGPQVLVGSSMGAWIALRLIQELRAAGEGDRIGGLVLLAPAPDFTAELIEPALTRKQKRSLEQKGFFEEKSEYSTDPNIYTRALIEDGRVNRVMTGPIDTHCPVHVLQGIADPDVPHTHALRLVGLLPADDVTLSLIPGGDHRLSRPEDLDLLVRAVEGVLAQALPQDP
jgi:alpha-beta hydrolase superfamily lysophospholipase